MLVNCKKKKKKFLAKNNVPIYNASLTQICVVQHESSLFFWSRNRKMNKYMTWHILSYGVTTKWLIINKWMQASTNQYRSAAVGYNEWLLCFASKCNLRVPQVCFLLRELKVTQRSLRFQSQGDIFIASTRSTGWLCWPGIFPFSKKSTLVFSPLFLFKWDLRCANLPR